MADEKDISDKCVNVVIRPASTGTDTTSVLPEPYLRDNWFHPGLHALAPSVLSNDENFLSDSCVDVLTVLGPNHEIRKAAAPK